MSQPAEIAAVFPRPGRKSTRLATLVVFVAFFDFFVGLPLVPTYARDLGASDVMVGVIVGAYSVTNLGGNVAAGFFLDRFGRRWPMLAGLAVTAVALIGYAAANSAESLLAVRAIHGFAAAVLTPGAFAMLGDATPPEGRARTMGRSAAGIAIAAVVGPLFAGVAKEVIGYDFVFFVAAGLMTVTAIVYWVVSRRLAFAEPQGDQQGLSMPNLAERPSEVFKRAGLLTASVAALALTVGIGTLSTYLPLHMEELGQSASRSGAAFTVYAIMALIVMVGAVGVIGDRYGRLALVSAGLGVFGAGLLLMAATPALWAIFVGMAVIGLGFGLLFPAAAALVADSGGPRRRGTAFGIFYGAYSLGVVIGAFMSGQLADASTGTTGAPYAVAGVVVLVSVVICLAAWRQGVGAVDASGMGAARASG